MGGDIGLGDAADEELLDLSGERIVVDIGIVVVVAAVVVGACAGERFFEES